MEKQTEKIKLTVNEEGKGQRIDKYISTLLTQFSRSSIKSWIESGNILLDNASVKPRTLLSTGQVIDVHPQFEDREEAKAEEIDLSIIYEDEDILVIDKPSGMVVHPGHGNLSGTLQNGLLFYNEDLNILPRAGLIHRLDKDTTGLILAAKTTDAYNQLVKDMQARLIQREYRAICKGEMVAGGMIEVNLARDPHNRLKFKVSDKGRESRTHYRVLCRLKGHTLLAIRLDTGRTHQIRVHMVHIKYPILGDQLYGGRLAIPKKLDEGSREMLVNFNRQALHAFRLSFMHPANREMISLTSPIPDDMESMIIALSDQRLDSKTINEFNYPE
ncbi:MAG: 23S rRNA pseudouridine(1911/1915/1917) synthase RluD [Gammaproteobacteria bacterium]|jgi:23S rRNA pseudouridine1911/1915/1917 synthase|nr:23S rRNA pseudouridine(1911/1915/1917) synthase RluD [Gammaproteobacteria bacterium]MDP6146832.1 23S rRNA pseudouridine(1911/1915/1917) synthase RluD [Gammaproteobacteria bacterium]HJN00846.1 23S rRNA pseudouridine(1911/1915/1917) synthase RluD [Gammaproteobacteria bacterium]|tara:strand:- start:12520 stop:13509 length:990 start_codon:yes stop_codon:yes gene_type:complete